jgi:hypothetical protein
MRPWLWPRHRYCIHLEVQYARSQAPKLPSSQAPKLGRFLRAPACVAVVVVAASAPWLSRSMVAQVPPPVQARHATYDFTEGSAPGEPNLGLNEVWVDSKSPGDGFTYSVGTIEVQRTIPGVANPAQVLYSGQPILPAAPLVGFDDLPVAVVEKQVIVLQCVDANQAIVWQRFYYGRAEDGNRQMNVRGISVWPAADPADTRIAIFGESTHDSLPLDQFELQQPQGFASPRWRGFVAVFNNEVDFQGFPDPQLLWSHQFYGRGANLALLGDMAITDASIRVEGGFEVVTYCGFSTCGVAGLTADSTVPVNFFQQPTAPGAPCADIRADGDTNNGINNFDGFVGRITKSFGNPAAATIPIFHAVVGGNVSDGLFGLAEADEDRFCVVGFTALNGPVGGSGETFPFTDGICLGAPAAAYSLGVVMQFDASATPGGNLILDWSQRLGQGAQVVPATFTVARDVVMQRGWNDEDLAVVVGSTDDPDVRASLQPVNLPAIGPQAAKAGAAGTTDGFVVTCNSRSQFPIGNYLHFTYRGGAGNDGLTGVSSWNEFVDHFSVLGFVDAQPTGADLEVGSYWVDTATLSGLLANARTVQPGVTASYQPTAMGLLNAGLAANQGGGITVDPSGRVSAVGALVGPGLRYNATAAAAPIVAGRANNFANEAFRVVLDMLPNSCGRTDGTGTPTGAGNPVYPLPGVFGGTTPECALLPFGNLIGVPPGPVAALRRMHIDYLGNDPADNEPLTVVVDRPPTVGLPVQVAAWQLGFPGVVGGGVPAPVALPTGVIVWTTNSPSLYTISSALGFGSVSQSWTLPNLPLGQTEVVSVQLFVLQFDPGQAVPGGNLGPACVGLSDQAASPALWFSFTGQ